MAKIVDHAARRREIAMATAQVIAAHGIDGVTMVRIARAAGVTTGAVTHYFADKESVIAAALDWASEGLLERVRRALVSSKDLLAVLMAVLPTDPVGRTQWLVRGVQFGRASRAPEVRARAGRLDEAWFLLMERELRRLASAGVHRLSDEPRLEAQLLVATLDGLANRLVADPAHWTPDRLRAILAHHLARLKSDVL